MIVKIPSRILNNQIINNEINFQIVEALSYHNLKCLGIFSDFNV